MDTVAIDKSDVQGFITSGYGHTYHAAYLFVQLSDVEQAKSWLTDITPQVQTAASWRKDVNGNKIKPEYILNIAFSMAGLQALQLSEIVLNSFPLELQEGITEAKRGKLLGDVESSSPEHWQIGGTKSPEFHFVLMLHAGLSPEDETSIKNFTERISQGLDSHGMQIVHLEWGSRRRDDKEHFGFKDGISQPKIRGINQYGRDGKPIKVNIVNAGEFILGYKNQYDIHPSVPAVPIEQDPHDILPMLPETGALHKMHNGDAPLKDLGKHGSYIVYRKLKQDVALFWNFLKAESERLDGHVNANRMVWLASKFVGRYPNGDPLVASEKEGNQNGFVFSHHDPDGMKCPFGSHIRRANPRDVFFPTDPQTSLKTVDKHRILRRGRNFGETLFDLSRLNSVSNTEQLHILLELGDDGAERGIHFFGVNASIQMQFEFIQDSWTNNPHFNAQYQNKDPLIGDHGTSYQHPSYMHIPYEPVRIRTAPLPRFTDVLGGAYLFMPSITALRFLAR
ncbi:MAG: hypothetical protein AAF846_01095 [Chloroflexota bacterium]